MYRFWQQCLTAFYFTLFGICALLLSWLWLPLLALVYKGRNRTLAARKSIYYGFKLFWWLAHHIGFMHTHLEGQDKLGSHQGMLVIANHPTYLDYVLIASCYPYLDCLIKEQILHKPTLKFLAKAADYLVNSEGGELLEESLSRLKNGENILMFPEGTRTPASGELKFKHGFASIALRAGCPICLITVRCSVPFLAKSLKWYNVTGKRILFTVKVEKILLPEEISQLVLPAHSAYQQARSLTKQLEQYFQQKL
ncbi:MAG: 1-acyl-sn-glycerol-3-phosphate acyltransferase [Succinivibrio sp.]|nr:1-acyl-sn-glycerol-3-phosphate acyltransferase [Succinivibrio sp.]